MCLSVCLYVYAWADFFCKKGLCLGGISSSVLRMFIVHVKYLYKKNAFLRGIYLQKCVCIYEVLGKIGESM